MRTATYNITANANPCRSCSSPVTANPTGSTQPYEQRQRRVLEALDSKRHQSVQYSDRHQHCDGGAEDRAEHGGPHLPQQLFAEDADDQILERSVAELQIIEPVEPGRVGEVIKVVRLIDEKRAVDAERVGQHDGGKQAPDQKHSRLQLPWQGGR